MRKLFLVAFAAFSMVAGTVSAQQMTQSSAAEPPSAGRAPQAINGVGQLDVRVKDEQGNPVRNASIELKSRRTDGFLCEAYSTTDARGIALDSLGRPGMPPLHMGNLKVKVKAKGFRTAELDVPYTSLNEPLRVTLVRKG